MTQVTWGKTTAVDGIELLFINYEGPSIKAVVSQMLETIDDIGYISVNDFSVVIEILNGTTINGLAGQAKEVFKIYGFDTYIGNADNSDYENTTILNRQGNSELAETIGGIIHCDNIHETGESSVDTSVDITIILGKDFDGTKCR